MNMKSSFGLICAWLVFVSGYTESALAQTAIDVHQSVFTESETTDWSATIDGMTAQTNVVWTLSWNQTVLNRGQQRTDRDKPDQLDISLEMPNLESADPMKLVMTLQIPVLEKESADRGRIDPVVKTFQFPLIVTSNNLFKNRQEWLKSKNISVFDRNGKTLKAFEQANIPHTKLNSLDSFVADANSLMVIAEGTDWNRRAALKEKLDDFLQSGANVIVLSPGKFEVAVARNDTVELRCGTTRLPGFLNPHDLPKDLAITETKRRFSISDGTNGMDIESKPESSWSWLLLTHCQTERTNHLLILGHPVIEGWNDSPHGQLIVLNLLEYLEQHATLSKSEGN